MRLHLHVRERGEYHEDEEGAEFPSLADALQEAFESARELLAERIRRGKPINGLSFEIADEWGRVLEVYPWDSALVRA